MANKKSDVRYNNVMDNKDVLFGYNYWLTNLTDMTMDLFEYQGLPDTLPQEEIEKRLIRYGFAIIFKHPVEGIVTSDGNLYGYNFYRQYEKYNVHNPYRTFLLRFIPNGKKIGKDGEVIYNTGIEKYVDTDLHRSSNLFYNTIKRYARLMADIESTLNTELINARMPYVPIVRNQQEYATYMRVINQVENGKKDIPIAGDFLKDINILKNHDLAPNYINELINARKNIINMFFEEIGFYKPNEKRDRLINAEVDNGQNVEKTLIYSMLRERELGLKKINKFFGLNVTVNLRTALYNDSVDINEMDEDSIENETYLEDDNQATDKQEGDE